MRLFSMLFGFVLFACSYDSSFSEVDIQGHRGARGLAPENSIPGFLLATELGVTTLEMDVVISADQQVVVSHEPYLSAEICCDMQGRPLPRDSIINIFQLTYEQIVGFNCGILPNRRFPNQSKESIVKPLLAEVFDTIQSSSERTIRYNIELKSKGETDGIFHPSPSRFIEQVMEVVLEKEMENRVTVQSFDFRVLQAMKSKFPDIPLALLIENDLSWEKNVDSLGFTPAIYSPYYKLISRRQVANLQKAGMEVIPWTVNETEDIEQVLSWKVDGIISDYPDRVLEITKN